MTPASNEPIESPTWLPPALVVAALLLCALGLMLFQDFFHDDAYISLRYAQKFLYGHGLVWNPGERVEGYSNFLWVILVSLLGSLKIDLVLATRVLGIASFLACGSAVFLFCRGVSGRRRVAPALALLLLLTSLPMIVWSIGGLESVLFALILLLAVWALLRTIDRTPQAAILAGVLFGLLSMTRPDGPLYCVVAVGWLLLYNRRGLPYVIGIFAVAFGAFLLWRHTYYGDWLPNPYYVKGEVSLPNLVRGLTYLKEYALSLPYLLPLVVVSFLWIRIRGEWRPRHSLFLLLVGGHLVYIMSVGGDHMPAFRFLVPIIPLSAVLIAEAAAELAESGSRIRQLVAPLALLALVTIQVTFPPEVVARATKEDGAAFLGRIIGEYINVNFPKGSLIALNTAGSTPYYAPDHRFIDMLGLNDRVIAQRKNPPRVARWQDVPGHEKGDGKYILSRKPDYIIAGGAAGYAVTMGWFLSEYELSRDPEFARLYTPQMVLIPVTQYDGYRLYEESETGELGFAFYRRNQP